jgi:hypothetical protein
MSEHELSEKGRAFIRRAAELIDEGLTDEQVNAVMADEFDDALGLIQEKP